MLRFFDDERIGVFIDGSHIFAAGKHLQFDIDYRRLYDFIDSQGRLLRAFYYTALLDGQEYTPVRPLIDWLNYNNFTVVTKPVKEFVDFQGRRKVKSNVNVEIAMDMVEMSPYANHMILFAGDGDLRRLVDHLQRQGVRITVVSTAKTKPPMISDDLRRQTDNFVDLQDIAKDFTRPADSRQPQHEQGFHQDDDNSYGLPDNYTN